jgi:DNA processing protein
MDIDTNRAEIEAWLILLRAPGIGASGLRSLIERHGGAMKALRAARRGETPIADAACRDWLRAPDTARIAADLEWLAAKDHQLLSFDNPDFPALLRDSAGAPAALFVVGDATALWRAQVAIVGSRSASHAGLDHARSFARALVAAGFAITSGLAEGIDGAAHAAALDAGGITLAVLGTGPDVVYPAKHQDLAARIAANGARVSEFPPSTPGRPENFPRRNRIIAGLALGTLVVEAGLRSGSLITARCASEQGRDVFAIPGSIHNPLARGCHRLIRQGAALVESAEEIVEGLAPLAQRLGAHLRERLSDSASPATDSGTLACDAEAKSGRDPACARVLAALGHEALGIDRLAERTGLGIAALSSMLLVLELEGSVAVERGGAYIRRNPEPPAGAAHTS